MALKIILGNNTSGFLNFLVTFLIKNINLLMKLNTFFLKYLFQLKSLKNGLKDTCSTEK